jgi:putative molybdopterin biosynthesis protein
MPKKVFRDLVSVENAISIIKENFKLSPFEFEEVPLEKAYGRVLAVDCVAEVDVPPFDRSTMDGYAVIAQDTFEAEEDSPVKLKIVGKAPAGENPDVEVHTGEAVEISTGAPIPKGANAVVMEEYTSQHEDYVLIYRAVAPGENIMSAGSDIMAGELIARAGTVLSSREIGVLSASGIDAVKVFKKPVVAIFSTGNELVSPGEKLDYGKIYDVNSYALIASIREDGGEPVFIGIARDNEEDIVGMLEKALNYDVVICSGGTSAGTGDMIYRVLDYDEPGILVHGISVKPGKPTIIASINGKPVFGLPGNPTSALMIYHIFVSPVIRRMAGLRPERDEVEIEATLSTKVFSSPGRIEYLPVNIVKGEAGYSAYPVSGHYSGAITSLAETDGFIEIEENRAFMDARERVRVRLFSNEIKPADLMIIGSHCVGIDVLLEILNRRVPLAVKVINTGSSGGIAAVKRGEADIAGTHLLDESGEYNLPYIRRYGLAGKVYLIKGYLRDQGIIVKKGNPKGIEGVEDLLNVTIINRNRGSGTRMLFDMYLKEIADKESIPLDSLVTRIKGYVSEAKSHTAVAMAVLMGKADAGIGIRTVAERYGLDFIPLRGEEYDFLVRKERMTKREVKEFFEILRSEDFKIKLQQKLPGLRTYERTGEVIEV